MHGSALKALILSHRGSRFAIRRSPFARTQSQGVVRKANSDMYVTLDGRHVVSGSIPERMLTVIDAQTHTIAGELPTSAGVRPMTFETAPDGSMSRIFVQLCDYHGVAVVDFATRKEVTRFELPPIPGEEGDQQGLRPALAYSLPDLKPIGSVHVGQHPEWLTFSPDGEMAYVAVAGANAVSAVDIALKIVAKIPVGQVPKRNATAMLRR
jgi:DNA-binding beta-propeller fold protein YncE